jgi:hypothetical protein
MLPRSKFGFADALRSDRNNGVPTRDFFNPTPEQQKVVLVEASALREAERLIESCEQCNPKDAEIPFHAILLAVNIERNERNV